MVQITAELLDGNIGMDEIKNDAESLRLSLQAGLIQPSEVIAWADAQIAASDIPQSALIDVSLAGSKSPAEIERALSNIEGWFDDATIALATFRKMAMAIERKPVLARNAAKLLCKMAKKGIVPSREAESAMFGLDEDFYLAESGTYRTVDDVRRDLVAFLKKWAGG
jgi:hypothetical protein